MAESPYERRKTPRERELDAKVRERNAKARGVIKKSWDVANEPLWHGPQRWARQASDWLTTPKANDDYATAVMRGLVGGMTEGVGNIASGLTSPIGIATTALGLGSTKAAATAIPALAELAASRPTMMGIKALGGLGAGRGAIRIAEAGLNEENKTGMERLGDVGTGSLEFLGGLAGANLPLPPPGVRPRIGTPAVGTAPTGTPMTKGPHIPAMLGDVEGIRTSTSPKWTANPSIGTRMSTVEPTKMSAVPNPNLPARDISPERSAFEALVPNRYKSQVTAEGLTLNLPERFTATESTPSSGSVVTPPTSTKVEAPKAAAAPAKFDASKYTDENLAALAKRGNAEAQAEVARRKVAKTESDQAAIKAAGEKAFAEGQAAGKAKAEAAPPKPPTPPAAPPKKPTKPAAPPPIIQEPPSTGKPVTLEAGHKAVLEKLKKERAAQVSQPVPGQEGVTPVPEGVTVTKVPPGKSGIEPKPKAKGVMPLPGKSPLAPKQVDKWALLADDLRSQGIPEHQIADLVERGKSGQLESAPLEEVVAAVEAKTAPSKVVAPKAPKVKVDPKRAATLRAENKAAAEIPKPQLEGIPEKRPSNERPLAYAKDETIEARAKQGDPLATKELEWRQAEAGASFADSMKATVEAGKPERKSLLAKPGRQSITSETGSVGPGTGKIAMEQAAAKERRAIMDENHPFVGDNLENWKAEQLEMGHDQASIDEAVRRAARHGIDPTKSDDLDDLGHYMMSLGELDTRQQEREIGNLGNRDLIDWEKNQRLGKVDPIGQEAHPYNYDWAANRENEARAKVSEEIAAGKNKPIASEDYPGQQQFTREIQDARNKQNFELRKRMAPDKFAGDMKYARQDYPNLSDAELEEYVYRRFAEKQDEISRSISEESQGRHFERGQETDSWGKYRPKWENPPFRDVNTMPEIAGEMYDQLRAEGRLQPYPQEVTERMVPNERWYAGQNGIDRAQVERIKRYGVNNPGDDAVMPPAVVIDENGNYQITDGHHRSTAALETNQPLDYQVTDRSPSGWFREMRGLRGENDPFIKAGRSEAERGIASFEGQGASSGGGFPEDYEPSESSMFNRGRGGQSAWSRALSEETGAVGPGTGRLANQQRAARGGGGGAPLTGAKAFAARGLDLLNQVRMTEMLSGLAVPKSILGNLGSPFIGAMENKSLDPIRQLKNFGQIGRDIKQGWQTGQNPALTQGLGKINIPGRIMGAGDYAAESLLKRAGLTEAAAKEQLLTTPLQLGGQAAEALEHPIGKALVPFRTTPFNQAIQGVLRSAKHPYIYGGAVAAGAGAGALTDDPDKLGLGSATLGPYALPFLAGASTTAGMRALQGISPIPEWSIQKTLGEPWAAFTEPPGKRWFEPNLGFGKKTKDETGSRPTQRSRPTGRPTRR